ncbi:uncharacterized protein TRIVIDRAFT_92970, partial [Trichoderma virens Gv29-8]
MALAGILLPRVFAISVQLLLTKTSYEYEGSSPVLLMVTTLFFETIWWRRQESICGGVYPFSLRGWLFDSGVRFFEPERDDPGQGQGQGQESDPLL